MAKLIKNNCTVLINGKELTGVSKPLEIDPTEEEIKEFLADVKEVCKKHNIALNGVDASSGMYGAIEFIRPSKVNQSTELSKCWDLWHVEAITKDEESK